MKENEKPKKLQYDKHGKSYDYFSDGNAAKQEKESVPILYQLPKKKQKKRSNLSSILFATLSAIGVGTFLGIMTLHLFVNINQSTNGSQTSSPVMTSTHEEVGMHRIESLSAYMIQAGVFTDLNHAEKWMAEYEDKNYPVTIVERDEQWYLFIGIYATEEEAKQEVEKIRGEGIDVFVKSWSTNAEQKELSRVETRWFEDMNRLFEEALIQKDSSILVEALEQSSETERINAFISELKNINTEGEQFLLDWMSAYEELEKII